MSRSIVNTIAVAGLLGLSLALVVSVRGWRTANHLLDQQRTLVAASDTQWLELKQAIDALFQQIELDPAFDKLPSGSLARGQALKSTRIYYQRFLDASREDPQWGTPTGDAQLRLGKIAQALGEWPEAITHFQAGIELLRSDRQFFSPNTDRDRLMVDLLHHVSQAQYAVGELQAALHSSDRAMESQQRLSTQLMTQQVSGGAALPEPWAFGQMLTQRALIHRDLGDLPTAMEELRRAGDIFLAPTQSTFRPSPTAELVWLRAQADLSKLLFKSGNATDSNTLNRQVSARLDQLQQDFPEHLDVLELQIIHALQQSESAIAGDRITDALNLLTPALAEAQRLCELHPQCPRYQVICQDLLVNVSKCELPR